MRPNGKKKEDTRDPEELQIEEAAADAFYQMYVASIEEIMAQRKEGSHPVNAAYQMGYFVLYANMFRDMGMYPDELKKKIIKVYTNACSQYINRITVVDTINHFEELYTAIVEDSQVNEDVISSQKRYIIAVEIEVRGNELKPDDAADCLMIASTNIAKTMELFADGPEE